MITPWNTVTNQTENTDHLDHGQLKENTGIHPIVDRLQSADPGPNRGPDRDPGKDTPKNRTENQVAATITRTTAITIGNRATEAARSIQNVLRGKMVPVRKTTSWT